MKSTLNHMLDIEQHQEKPKIDGQVVLKCEK